MTICGDGWSSIARRLAGLVAVVALLAGCGGGGADGGSPQASPPETAPPPAQETEAETLAPAADTEPASEPASETDAGAETSAGPSEEELDWLAGAGLRGVFGTYFANSPNLEGELRDTIDVQLADDFLSLEVSSGDIFFTVPTTADSCKQELAAGGEPPTPRLEEIVDLVWRACLELERTLSKLSFAYQDGEATQEPDYQAALKAMRRATRLSEQARSALGELGESIP